ncbi:MAG: MauE/DoxX family redox-associated membrane protein [Flavisolibacter sp.]
MLSKISATINLFSYILILLFSYAAISKWLDYPQFLAQLGQSPLLTPFAIWIGVSIPSLELIICFLLIIEPLRLWGLYASYLLLLLFTGYIFVLTHFSEYVPCSCGGILQNLSWKGHLWFNLFFALGTAIVILLYYKREHLKNFYCNKTGVAENLKQSKRIF